MIWIVRLLTFVLFLTISGAVGLAFIIERASRSPLDAHFLTPWIERNASAQLAGGTVSIGETRIALQPGQQGAHLLLTDVTATGGAVADPLHMDEVLLQLSLPDALVGQLRITRMDIEGFRVSIRRETDGRIGYSITPTVTQPDRSGALAVPGWGDVAEASTSAPPAGRGPDTVSSGDAQRGLNQLRASLTADEGALALFEAVRIANAEVIFDDTLTDKRVVIHDATLSLETDRTAVRVDVEGLFEAGSSISDGRLQLTTPLDPGADLAFDLALNDFALSDAAAYLPAALSAEERTDGVDLQLTGSLRSTGRLDSFSARLFALGKLSEAHATFLPEPTLAVAGRRRVGGAGGWSLSVVAPAIDFASEPILRSYLSDTFSYAGEIGGTVGLEVAEDGRLLGLDFATTVSPGLLTIPDLYTRQVRLDAGRFEGRFTPEGLDFTRLELAPVINGRSLPLRGLELGIQRRPDGEQAISFGMETDWALRPVDILALWPDVTDDPGRQWFEANVTDGQTREQALFLSLTTTRDRQVRIEDLRAAIAFTDGRTTVTEGLGQATGMNGQVEINNGLYQIELARGRLGTIDAADTSITVDLREPDAGTIAFEGAFNGALRQSLAFLSRSNVGLDALADAVPLDRLSGTFGATGQLRASLQQPARFAPVFDFQVEVSDARVSNFLGGLDLSADYLPMRVGPDRIATTGPVRLGKIAAETTTDIRLTKGGVEELKLKATFAGLIADAAGLLGPLPDYIQGRAEGALTYTQTNSGQRVLEISSTLDQADINLAPLPYFKPIGQPAQAEAIVLLDQNGLDSIKRFSLNGPALNLMGEIDLRDGGTALARAELQNLIVGDSGIGRLVVVNEPEFITVTLADGQLDGRPLIEAIVEGQGKRHANIITGDTATNATTLNNKPWIIAISGIRRFVVPGGKAFTDITLQATIDQGAVHQFDLSAKAPPHLPGRAAGLGNLRASLIPRANGFYRLAFQSDDAGSLFATLGLTTEIRGGEITVEAQSALPLPKGGWLGRMELNNFSVLQAPVMIQLLSVASLTGILELASGSGLQFESLDSNFTYGNSALYLDDLRMVGPSVGLTAEGSVDFGGQRFGVEGNVTPFNILSEFAGALPVIGGVLTGTDGGGVFSAGYRIDGTFDAPAVTVNPFQVLTPGVYRQWFQDIFGN